MGAANVRRQAEIGLARQPRRSRHWKGADRLRKAGVRTAACYAMARIVSGDGDAVEWLIMDRLPGKTLLQHRPTTI